MEVDRYSARHHIDHFQGFTEEGLNVTVKVFWHYNQLVPEPVRATLAEALRCHRAHAWNGTTVLARKAVEIMARNLGAHGRTLFAQLQELKDRGLIAEEYWYAEDTVRNLGNLAVHFDAENNHECTSAEADCALAYAYEVSKQIYLRSRAERFTRVEDKEEYLQFIEVRWRERYGILPAGF